MSRPVAVTELMDQPNVDPAQLAQALAFIRKVNRFLGGTRAVLGHLQRWEPSWPRVYIADMNSGATTTDLRGRACSPQITATNCVAVAPHPATNIPSTAQQPIRILDVATGSADIPQAIMSWARRIGRPMQVIGLDLHPTTLQIARQWVGNDPEIQLIQGDALALPLEDNAVDIATCSMFLHHLDEPQALQVIREMLRVSRHGIIVNDLLRSTWAKVAIHLLTVFSSPIDKHDARVSVAKGWLREEVKKWPTAVGAPWFNFLGLAFARFTVAGRK